MKELDPLQQWRESMKERLKAEGYLPWTGAPKLHPYIRYEPTDPNPRPRAALYSQKQFRRAVARAYKTERLVPWAPLWMHVALFPADDEVELPLPAKNQRHIGRLCAYRFASKEEELVLDVAARLGGANAVWAIVTGGGRTP